MGMIDWTPEMIGRCERLSKLSKEERTVILDVLEDIVNNGDPHELVEDEVTLVRLVRCLKIIHYNMYKPEEVPA